MNNTSSSHVPFVPSCLFLTASYNPKIELLMDRATRKIPAVWSRPPSPPRDNLITFFHRMSYIAAIVIEVSIECNCTWQETMEAWQS